APFVQNQFGGSAGGPIVKDRLFFFGSYEGYRQRQGNLFLLSVPTAQFAAGDFSDYRGTTGAVVPLYDPLTTCGQYNNAACGSQTILRTPFPGNVIPLAGSTLSPRSSSTSLCMHSRLVPEIPSPTTTTSPGTRRPGAIMTSTISAAIGTSAP